MKTKTITLCIGLLLCGSMLLGQPDAPTPPPPPPPIPAQSVHEQHMQQHLQHHNEAHRQAVESSNRAHEEAIRHHESFHGQFSGMAPGHTPGVLRYETLELPRRFKVGDMYYASSFRGLQSFMTDLKAENPILHEVMEPAYLDIKRKRNATVAIWTAGAGIGTAMIVGGFSFLNDNERIFSGDPFDGHNPKKPNVGLIAGGAGVMLASGIIGILIQPRQEDIYQFVNLHNRHNPDRKMDWEIGLDMFRNNTPGAKLTLNF